MLPNLKLYENEEIKIDDVTGDIEGTQKSIFILQDETAIEHLSTILKNTISNYFLINLNGNERQLKQKIKESNCEINNLFFVKEITKKDIDELKNLTFESNFFRKMINSTVEFMTNLI